VTEPLPVTLCVSTRNAGHQLAGCIESCAAWVSEVVVVDMESTDDTVEVARRYGATVLGAPNAGFAEPARQSGIDAGTQPWMLVLDADERATDGLRDLVARVVARGDLAGMRLPRRNIFFGRAVMHGAGAWPDFQLRLFRPDRTRWPPKIHTGPEVDGAVEFAPADQAAAIDHHAYDSVSEWMERADRYTWIEAERRREAGTRASIGRLIARPAGRFFESYVVQRGALDGYHGLALALLAGAYEVLSELKLWQLSQQ
jgi:glycosyltransferase involved in cell wall biosynthesis